jgi:hypothetical protein
MLIYCLNKKKEYSTTISCRYSGTKVSVFATRVHTHQHGDVNSAYRVRGTEWTELVISDPQWPQTYYPTQYVYEIKDGDMLVGMCTYHNDEDNVVSVGYKHHDEMCNIYLMYFTKNRTGTMNLCFGSENSSLEALIPDKASRRPPVKYVGNLIYPKSKQPVVQLENSGIYIFMILFLTSILTLCFFTLHTKNAENDVDSMHQKVKSWYQKHESFLLFASLFIICFSCYTKYKFLFCFHKSISSNKSRNQDNL